jgi:hypothetical protein
MANPRLPDNDAIGLPKSVGSLCASCDSMLLKINCLWEGSSGPDGSKRLAVEAGAQL